MALHNTDVGVILMVFLPIGFVADPTVFVLVQMFSSRCTVL